MIFVGIVALSGIVAAAMSFAVGANDVANALGTAVGSKSLSLRGGIIIGSIMEFLGCISMGGNVSSTLAKDLVKLKLYDPNGARMYMSGMFSALVGSSAWLLLATYLGMPVSTTHTIVSGVCMFGLMAHGFDGITYDKLIEILISWVTTPFMGACIGYAIYFVVYRYILRSSSPQQRARRYLPLMMGFAIIGILQIIFLDVVISQVGDSGKGLKWMYVLIAFGVTVVIVLALSTFLFFPLLQLAGKLTANPDFYKLLDAESRGEKDFLLAKDRSANNGNSTRYTNHSVKDANNNDNDNNNNNNDNIDNGSIEDSPIINPDTTDRTSVMMKTDLYFIPLQILTSALVGFAHGANDIANSIGPFAAIYEVGAAGEVNEDVLSRTQFWIVIYGASFLVFGIALYGYKVMATIGEKVVPLTSAKGFSVECSTAWTVLLATYFGIPVSTTHCVVASVIGVGFVEDRKSFNWRIIGEIVSSWFLTIPAGAIFTGIVFVFVMGVDSLWIHEIAY